jgi:hypothetical protein
MVAEIGVRCVSEPDAEGVLLSLAVTPGGHPD